MATQRYSDEHERSAAGLDYDEHSTVRENAAKLGAKMVEDGPEVLLDEIENLLPEAWRDQIRTFPVAAVLVGLGVGVWLGMKKSDEIIAAGGSLVSAAAMANVSQVMDKFKQ
ncbi:MAG TPA: hypothetical protein VF432_03045 [Thermoanaerobaculia bacterium]